MKFRSERNVSFDNWMEVHVYLMEIDKYNIDEEKNHNFRVRIFIS